MQHDFNEYAFDFDSDSDLNVVPKITQISKPKSKSVSKLLDLELGTSLEVNSEKSELSVHDLNQIIKSTLEGTFDSQIMVCGELSNVKISNQNLFATLKDEMSSISIVFWSFEKKIKVKKTELKDGLTVAITGKIVLYQKTGTYNINVAKLELKGIGDLSQEYEKMKKMYEAKGYFDPTHKQKLETITHIKNIGIITSAKGAALQDMLYVLNKSDFKGVVVIHDCLVQGNGCPTSVANAIQTLNEYSDLENKIEKLDLIVVSRGGGSTEDLIGFSHPKVIEALYDSKIPTISAIGHEVDFMLSDFVADVRAPTPSIAAEQIAKLNSGIYTNVLNTSNNILHTLGEKIQTQIMHLEHRIHIQNQKIKTLHPSNQINNFLKSLNNNMQNISTKISTKINYLNFSLNEFGIKLHKYDPSAVFNLGYCRLINPEDFSSITSLDDLIENKSKKLKLEMKNNIVLIKYTILKS